MAAVFFGLLLSAPASDSDIYKKAANTLVAAVKAEAKEKEKTNGAEMKRSGRSIVTQLEYALSRESPDQVEDSLYGFSTYITFEKSQHALADFKAIIRHEREARHNADIDTFEKLLTDIREIMIAAKSPAELDPVLARIDKAANFVVHRYSSINDILLDKLEHAITQVRSTRQSVTTWQNYLQASLAGNPGAAIHLLESLALLQPAFIAPSVIQERITIEQSHPSKLDRILAGLNTLDDIGPSIETLQSYVKAESNYGSDDRVLNLLGTLIQIEASYHEFQVGMPLNLSKLASLDTNTSSIGIPRIIQMKSNLLLLVIPVYVKAPIATKASPKETVTALLARLIDEAKERKDYSLCERIRQAQALLVRDNDSHIMWSDKRGAPDNPSDAGPTGLQYYLGAQQEILAGQFMLAVFSLHKAVRSGDECVPVGDVGWQLGELKKNHPDDYQQGIDKFMKLK